MAGFVEIIRDDSGEPSIPFDLAPDIARLAAILTWRYTQGIYRFDSDLRAALAVSDLTGDIPAEVLYRLPEWCVYVETPGMSWLGADLIGFWAHLEHDANDGHSELRVLCLTSVGYMPGVVHIGQWPLPEGLTRFVDEARRQAVARGLMTPSGMYDPVAIADMAQKQADALTPLISLLLYLCSEAPEIDDARQPGHAPSHPHPVKTKRGWRLFPPSQPTIWTVGTQIGELLRRERTETLAAGQTVRPHIRRGHWHGYWTGPRSERQRFVYRWLPPMVIAGGRDDDAVDA